MSNLVDVDLEKLACDLRVEVRWEELNDGRHLPLFTVISYQGGKPFGLCIE
jgi:hypothetical protein